MGGRSSLGLAIAHRLCQSLATLSPRLILSVWRIAFAPSECGDGSIITQYICDNHHSAPPRISAFLSSHRHLRRCISSQLRAAEWAALFFYEVDRHSSEDRAGRRQSTRTVPRRTRARGSDEGRACSHRRERSLNDRGFRSLSPAPLSRQSIQEHCPEQRHKDGRSQHG